MENNESVLSPQESLQLIESMINRARDKFAEDGQKYLLWGWLVFICGLSQFILLHFFHCPVHYLVWMLLWVPAVYQLIYLRKKKEKRKVRTYTDHIIAYVWLTFLIIIFLVAFLIGRLTDGEYYSHISPVILAMYGMPVFLSGIILRFRPLIIGGIGCWTLCILSTLIGNYEYQLLMIPLAMVFAWIIPGYLLRARYKKENG